MIICLVLNLDVFTSLAFARGDDSPVNQNKQELRPLCNEVDVKYSYEFLTPAEYKLKPNAFLSKTVFPSPEAGGEPELYEVFVAKFTFRLAKPIGHFTPTLFLNDELMTSLYQNMNSLNIFNRNYDDPLKAKISLNVSGQTITSKLETKIYAENSPLEDENLTNIINTQLNKEAHVILKQTESQFNKILLYSENITALTPINENSTLAQGEAHIAVKSSFIGFFSAPFVKSALSNSANRLICSYAITFDKTW